MHHTLQSGVQNYKHFLNYQNFISFSLPKDGRGGRQNEQYAGQEMHKVYKKRIKIRIKDNVVAVFLPSRCRNWYYEVYFCIFYVYSKVGSGRAIRQGTDAD